MIKEYLIWRFKYKAFSRSIVKPLHDEFNFNPGDRSEAGLLRKVLAKETIYVFIRTEVHPIS